MTLWWLFISAAGISLVFTGVIRRYALAHSVMDIPNERSSHTVPTPRGGGVAIVVSFLFLLISLGAAAYVAWVYVLALLGTGAWVAFIGFLDDRGHIPAKWRLLAHFVGAAWALYWLDGLPSIAVFGITLNLHWIGPILAAFYLVWMLNLYNFMDGIDGIASIEAICVASGGATLYVVIGHSQAAATPALLAFAVAGFLVWNFPPAKIFMGDAGSGFLGMVLGVLSLQAAWVAPQLLWSWLVLLGVFIVDATLTLFRRLLRGDKVYEAHRSHAYQYASRKYGRHLPVTLAVLVINIAWLFPIAYLIAVGILEGVIGIVVAYIPLLVIAVLLRAGQLEVLSKN
ncbi:MraY family glycosyltransferase [Paralcaligenes ureilyticus]|uniref:Fuc2NAc and GlcNAc transferase n=1 Tax=Paralcaligenes ureilyticus TaxID=627131 RepID=A0A4R3M7N1_9BURK|nr:glycosyltransferase family 4 protein [Paralcaligenes ureilyticus]TCT09082.1 Fuc2NAc and GlcNAc transferase [Paralcaligenes ureilyticus]